MAKRKFNRRDSGILVPDSELVRSRPFSPRHVRRHPNCGAKCCDSGSGCITYFKDDFAGEELDEGWSCHASEYWVVTPAGGGLPFGSLSCTQTSFYMIDCTHLSGKTDGDPVASLPVTISCFVGVDDSDGVAVLGGVSWSGGEEGGRYAAVIAASAGEGHEFWFQVLHYTGESIPGLIQQVPIGPFGSAMIRVCLRSAADPEEENPEPRWLAIAEVFPGLDYTLQGNTVLGTAMNVGVVVQQIYYAPRVYFRQFLVRQHHDDNPDCLICLPHGICDPPPIICSGSTVLPDTFQLTCSGVASGGGVPCAGINGTFSLFRNQGWWVGGSFDFSYSPDEWHYYGPHGYWAALIQCDPHDGYNYLYVGPYVPGTSGGWMGDAPLFIWRHRIEGPIDCSEIDYSDGWILVQQIDDTKNCSINGLSLELLGL